MIKRLPAALAGYPEWLARPEIKVALRANAVAMRAIKAERSKNPRRLSTEAPHEP